MRVSEWWQHINFGVNSPFNVNNPPMTAAFLMSKMDTGFKQVLHGEELRQVEIVWLSEGEVQDLLSSSWTYNTNIQKQ